MQCPYCRKPTRDHEACWNQNRFRQQWNFLFTNPEQKTHHVQGDWKTKTVWVNGHELTGARYRIFMEIDPIWEWKDSQDNYTDELAAWDQQFRWGDESPGTFFLSIALQRWITMRMSLMQQHLVTTQPTIPSF